MKEFLRIIAAGALLFGWGMSTSQAQEVNFSAGPAVAPSNGASNGGFAWLDINGDGTQDVFIPPNNVLLNYITHFTQVPATHTAALTANVNSVGALFADINGDGVPDLWSTNNAAPQTGLFYDDAGVYVPATGTGDLPNASATGMVFSGLAVADIDHSNYLSAAWQGFKQASWSDNYVYKPGEGITLLKGGPSGFTQVGIGAAPGNLAIDTSRAFETWDVHFLDADNDGWQDLLMVSIRHGFNKFDIQVDSIGARKGSILYMNDGTGKFYVPDATTLGRTLYNLDSISADGTIYSRAVADTGIIVDDTVKHFDAIGSQWGDLNNDGNVDLILTGLGGANYDGFGNAVGIVVVYGKGDGTFTYRWNGTDVVNSGLPNSGSIRAWDIGDYNNDGIQDVYASTTYGSTRLFRGNGNGTYTEVTSQNSVATPSGGSKRSGGFVDYNNDGFLDIYNYSQLVSLLQMNSGNSNHWIAFTPVGTGHNLNAVGARFTVYTQGGTFKQYRWIKAEGGSGGSGDMRALFGIGINTSIDKVEVLWPDGTTAEYTGLAVDRYWTIKQGSSIPNMPSLVSPASGTVSAAQVDTLKWDAALDALEYNVQVSLDPTFVNKLLLAVDETVSGTSYVYSLAPATKYYWRVAGVNGGFMSDYTAAYDFTTAGAAATEVPIVVSPANKVLENTIHNYNAAPVLSFVLPAGKTLADYGRFNFKGYFAQGDVGYKHIIVEAFQTMPTGHAFDNTANQIGDYNRALMGSTGWEDISIVTPNSSSLHDTIYVAFGINCAGTGDVGGTGVTTMWYADNVTLVDTTVTPNVGVSLNFESSSIGDPVAHIGWSPSDIQSVVARDPLGTGVTNQPANLTLAVNKTADASRYQWQVSTLPTFYTFILNEITAGTTYAGEFAGGRTYYLRVRGMNDLGASAFSAVDTFSVMVPPAKTTLVAPLNGTQNVKPDSVVLVWRSVSTAASYNLQVSVLNSSTTYTGLTDTTYMLRNLAQNLANYTWKVEAINAGGTSHYTDSFTFTTIIAAPGVPTLLLPPANNEEIPVNTQFTWRASPPPVLATKYRLQVALDNAFATVVRDTIVFEDTTLTLADALDGLTDYYWHVSGGNAGGFGEYSAFQLFTTASTVSVDELAGVPTEYALLQNYPNPFNPSTTIRYDLPSTAYVKITIYDVLGRVVATLVDGIQAANRYTVEWNATDVSSGVYFYRMEARNQDGSGDFNSVKKLLFMK
jgi:hypothetical protein